MKLFTHFAIALSTFPKIRKMLYAILASLAIGFACLYLMFFLSQAVQKEIARRFHSQGLDLFSIIKHSDAPAVGSGQIRPLSIKAIEFLAKDSDYVTDIAPEIRRTETLRFGTFRADVQLIGVLDGYRNVHRLQLKYGRFVSRLDSSRNYCVLGYRLYKSITGTSGDSLIGKNIVIGKELYSIIGVLYPTQSVSSEYSIDEAVLVPFETLRQFILRPEITKVTLLANPNRPIGEVIKYIQNRLQLCIGDYSMYEITNQQVFLQIISKRVETLSTIFSIVGGLALVIGIWASLRLLGISLLSRRNEITFYQILGVDATRVARQLLVEAILLFLTGVVIGLAFGVGISAIIARAEEWRFIVSYYAIFASLLIAIIAGTIVGWSPTTRTISVLSTERL